MVEEYIKKANIEMKLKFGDKRMAVQCLQKAVSLLQDEIKQKDSEIKSLKLSSKKPAAKKPAAKKPAKK
tara:strand:- start:361 stop:567 length:207 start_codon:yes stop_codon:yes gene_type:complete